MTLWQTLAEAKQVAGLSVTELLAAGLLGALSGWAVTAKFLWKRELELVSLLIEASRALAAQIQILQEIPRKVDDMSERLTEHAQSCRDVLSRVEMVIKNCPGWDGPGRGNS